MVIFSGNSKKSHGSVSSTSLLKCYVSTITTLHCIPFQPANHHILIDAGSDKHMVTYTHGKCYNLIGQAKEGWKTTQTQTQGGKS